MQSSLNVKINSLLFRLSSRITIPTDQSDYHGGVRGGNWSLRLLPLIVVLGVITAFDAMAPIGGLFVAAMGWQAIFWFLALFGAASLVALLKIDRDRILDAAEHVILESGGRNFTLDAVAERAGISKGGLVYSFATKDELFRAALEREVARFQEAVRQRLGEQAG